MPTVAPATVLSESGLMMRELTASPAVWVKQPKSCEYTANDDPYLWLAQSVFSVAWPPLQTGFHEWLQSLVSGMSARRCHLLPADLFLLWGSGKPSRQHPK